MERKYCNITCHTNQCFTHCILDLINWAIIYLGEDDLDLLTSLLAENEDVPKSSVDDLDDLFDNDDDDDVEYDDGIAKEEGGGKEDCVSDLFGDVDDIEDEETEGEQQAADAEDDDSLNKSKEDLQGLFS